MNIRCGYTSCHQRKNELYESYRKRTIENNYMYCKLCTYIFSALLLFMFFPSTDTRHENEIYDSRWDRTVDNIEYRLIIHVSKGSIHERYRRGQRIENEEKLKHRQAQLCTLNMYVLIFRTFYN